MNLPDRQRGFTMVEMMVVVALIGTLLSAVWTTANSVNNTAHTNSRRAEVATEARRTIRKIGGFLRPGKMSSFLAKAVAIDVTELRASTVGEWISPSEFVWRPAIQFVSADGLLSMNAALSTSPREIAFEMEPGETANGADDDGDGLVDEGTITLLHDLETIAMVGGVEECLFHFEGRTLSIRLRLGQTDGRGRVYRAQFEQAFYLRNN